MAKLRLSLACWDYDRTRALADGRVQPDGIELIYQSLPVEETFFRQARHREFDVAEMSLSSYFVSKFLPDDPFVAIPVFPSRAFRHSIVYVNERSGIREPKDLIGKRFGTPEYQLTANVWIRGILSDEYGVPVDSVTYLTGGEETPGRPEKLKLDLPPSIRVTPIGPTQTLAAMLAGGEIDAFHGPRKPSTHDAPGVRRLFPDYVADEKAYYARTGIFPIMHVVVIRRDVYERDRWVAMALYKAFAEAQRRTYEDFRQTAALKAMLPWAAAEAEATRALMGEDWWPYGLAGNEKTLATFARYSHEQGLSKRMLTPRDLFAPETLEAFTI
ncbi:MAG: ABC transporter substrate-binding protein [Candidatus Eremiobacteraeota bacterium]|nr:ABC transporter substrate-binding protein [Candidatus Eremiobacteraeota bacterium]MBV9408156.1 ABC transporter substrate-binding protein [Candidatus Eremiobacteraeota bacterium]